MQHSVSKVRAALGWGVAASLPLFGCGLTRHRSVVANAAYQTALSHAQQQGIPVTTQALAQPAPPSTQNAAPIYSKLTAVLSARPLTNADQDAEMYYHLDHPSPAQTAQAGAFLARRADILMLVHQAANRPQCVFNRPWTVSNPATVNFPELKSVRECARIISTESQLMAQSDHTQDAVRNEALGFHIARQAGSDGPIIPALVEIASDAITLRTLQSILLESHGDLQTARAVRQAIDRNFRTPSAATTLRRETAMQVGEIAWLRQTGPDGFSNPSATTAPRFTGKEKPTWDDMMNANGVYILREMQKMIAVADLPYPVAYAREEAITKQEGTRPAKHLVPLPWTSILDADQAMRHIVGQILLPAPSGLVQKRALVMAEPQSSAPPLCFWNISLPTGPFLQHSIRRLPLFRPTRSISIHCAIGGKERASSSIASARRSTSTAGCQTFLCLTRKPRFDIHSATGNRNKTRIRDDTCCNAPLFP